MLEETIAAISTPLGEGGLAVIRLSGPGACRIADACFQGRPKKNPVRLSEVPSHTLHYGNIVHGGKVLDEVMVAVMRAPRTFTREDVVEMSCHGGVLVAKAVLCAVFDLGARAAEPGEFTRRAFLNGRIDLTQAEAVADLIHARTELALSAANEQLAGALSGKINLLRDELVKTVAHIEAHIDFPDEDIAPDTRAQLVLRLENQIRFMDELLRTADEGRVLRNGVRVAIVGRPNAGKSSLLNQLLGHDRAIVSPVAGTTRDTIEEMANIRGIPVIFVDTAGLREAGDTIEAEGVRRTRESIARAEFVIHVIDASQPLETVDLDLMRELPGQKSILVLNKCDLPSRMESTLELTAKKTVQVSCANGNGIEALKNGIVELVWSGNIHSGMNQAMINARHQNALHRGREAVGVALADLKSQTTLELVALNLRIGMNAIGEIVGKTTTEDILDSIFSQFCIGK